MSSSRKDAVLTCLKQNLLTMATVAGVASGVVLGIILRGSRDEMWSKREIMYVSYAGELFLRMLKALILPLIVSSLISAVGTLDLSLSGRIGGRAVAYYMATTFCAVILGMILVVSIHPGSGDASQITREGNSRNVTTADTLMDLMRNMFPPNLVQACIQQYRTLLEYPGYMERNLTNGSTIEEVPHKNDWPIKHEYADGTNILGLVVFSTVFGITMGKMGPRSDPLKLFFTALAEAMMIITNWVIWLSPVGVMFLVAGQILTMKDYGVIVGQLGMYFITVLVGLFIHGFVVLPLIFGIITRTLPFRFISNMATAMVTAFGTASSSAALPVSIACLEDKNGVDPRVARFVLPIGATINMDGTALYEAVAAIFISQVRNVSLGIGKVVAISITATAASIGAAGIPQAGLVTLVMVLDTIGLPAEDVTLILAVDWLLDRFRTAINVLGDALGAGLVNHLSLKELNEMADVEVAPRSSSKTNGEKPPPYAENEIETTM